MKRRTVSGTWVGQHAVDNGWVVVSHSPMQVCRALECACGWGTIGGALSVGHYQWGTIGREEGGCTIRAGGGACTVTRHPPGTACFRLRVGFV